MVPCYDWIYFSSLYTARMRYVLRSGASRPEWYLETEAGSSNRSPKEVGVNLIEQLEARSVAMKVTEICELLGVDDKHIYRMAARGSLPSFRVGGAVRFDPQEVAKWLRTKYGGISQSKSKQPLSQEAVRDQERSVP